MRHTEVSIRGVIAARGKCCAMEPADERRTASHRRTTRCTGPARPPTAAGMFERRWTWAALRRVDPSVASRLLMQRDLFDQAAVTGTSEEVDVHGAALCRGYATATRHLRRRASPTTPTSWVRTRDLVHGRNRTAEGRCRRAVELHGKSVVWITPDEVAAVLDPSSKV